MAGCAVQSGGVVTTIVSDVSVTHRMAPSPPPPPMPSDLANLDFAILWRQIDDEGLPVKKNVGGPVHRTLDEICADAAMAHAVPYLSAAPGSQTIGGLAGPALLGTTPIPYISQIHL